MSRKSQLLYLPLFCLVVVVLLAASPAIAQATQSHGAQTHQPTPSQAPAAAPAVQSGQAQAPAAGQGHGGATGQPGCCMGKQQHGGDGCMMMGGAGQGGHGQMGQAGGQMGQGGPAQRGGRMMGRMGQAGAGGGAMGSAQAGQAGGQPQGHGGHGQGPAMDPEMQEHRDTVHSLLSNNTKIKRYVELLPKGVKATTESDDPATATLIKKHVPQVYKFLQNKKNVRNWDPLFVEIFKNSDKIKMAIEPTEKGVRVTETSDDPYTAQLIQEHSKVIDNFVATGWTAAQKENPVPAKK